MHDCALLGAAVLCHYRPFFHNLVQRVIASCTGGPDLAGYECEQCPAASTTKECLIGGVCVGVCQMRSRPRYSIDKDKDVIHLSVDHMVVNEVVGHSHGSAGMAYAMAFTLF